MFNYFNFRKFRRIEELTQSMNHLEATPRHESKLPQTSTSMYNVTDDVPNIIDTHHPKSSNTAPDDYANINHTEPNSEDDGVQTFDPTCVSISDMPTCCAMQSLHQRIAIEKAKLMKNLEDVNCEKRLVDEGIVRMNALQRQYIAIEKQMEYDGSNGHICQWHRDHEMCCSTSDKSRVESTTTSNQSNCNEFLILFDCTIKMMYFAF